jgi:CBS domain containing-hemolysin-like protein
VKLSKLFKRPGRLVSVLVILNVTVNVILTALWTKGSFQLASAIGVKSTAVFVTGAGAVLLVLIVLFAEITPKALFTKYAESISLGFTPLILFLCHIVGPIGTLLEGLANILLLPFRGTEKATSFSVTEEEIIDLVTVGESEGVIDTHEKEMIHSIIEFGDRQVKEVMVPRTDIVAVDVNTELPDAMRVIVSSGFSRIPVYDVSIDSVVGILMAKDILPFIGRGNIEGVTIRDLMRRSVYFIPETKLVRDLFQEFQRKKIYMAVAVDEHGGIAGVITTEDMLEEIVGEITDEYDSETPLIEPQTDGSYVVEGRLGLHEFNELIGLDLANDAYDTVGGLVLTKLGSIPEVGQFVEHSSLRFEVVEVDGNRITKLRVWVKQQTPKEDDDL